jgi:hypothetical protein
LDHDIGGFGGVVAGLADGRVEERGEMRKERRERDAEGGFGGDSVDTYLCQLYCSCM